MSDDSEPKGKDVTPPPKPVEKSQASESPEATAIPGPLEAVLEEVPPPVREKIRETFTAMLQYQGPVVHPLAAKMTASHLDKLIDGAEKDNERSYADKQASRSHIRFLVICGLLGFLGLALLLLWKDQSTLLRDFIQLAVAYVGGIGTGGLIRRRKG